MKINHRVRCKTMRRLFRFFSRSARIKHFGNVNDEISSLQLQLWPFIEYLTIKDRQFLLEVQTIQTREPPILKKAPNDKSVDEADEHTSQLMSYRDKLLSLIDKYTHANNLTKKEFKQEYTPSISMPSLYPLKQPDDHSTKTSTKKNINPKGNTE